MNNVLQIDVEQVESAITQLEELIAEVDEVEVTSNRTEGDEGKVSAVMLEGEKGIETLKTDMKELIQATSDFLESVKDRFDTADKKMANQIREELK